MSDIETAIQSLITHLEAELPNDSILATGTNPQDEWSSIYGQYWPEPNKRSIFLHPTTGKFHDDTGNMDILDFRTNLLYVVRDDNVETIATTINTFHTAIVNALNSYNGYMWKNDVNPFPELRTPLGGRIIIVTLQACGG